MVNIPGNNVMQKIVGKTFLAKGFFVIIDVNFQNIAIRSCNFASHTAIKSQNVIV